MQNKKDSRISLSPTVFRLPVGRGEAAWYDDVVGGGEPGPPIAPTTAAHWRGAASSAHARAPPPCPSTVACGATTACFPFSTLSSLATIIPQSSLQLAGSGGAGNTRQKVINIFTTCRCKMDKRLSFLNWHIEGVLFLLCIG